MMIASSLFIYVIKLLTFEVLKFPKAKFFLFEIQYEEEGAISSVIEI